MDAKDTALDVAHSTGTGIAKGTIGLAGFPGDIGSLLSAGVDAAGNYFGADPERLQKAKEAVSGAISRFHSPLTALTGPGSADIQKGVEGYTGEFYQPQTTLGQGAQTIGEFLPAALTGPIGAGKQILKEGVGTLTRRIVGDVTKYAVAPGVTSEVAGQLTAGTDAEPYARTGAALATGGLATLMAPGRTVPQAILSQLPEYVTPRHVQVADALIQRSAARGVDISWPQALTQVTGRPVMLDMQRILESARPSRTRMQEFFAPQAQQVEGAARQELGQIAPRPADPFATGPAVQQAAEQTVLDMRRAINAATKPAYDAAGQTLVPKELHEAMMENPLFARTLKNVRADPELNDNIRGMSDRNVMVYDAIKKYFNQRGRNLASPLNPEASQEAAATNKGLASDIRNFAVTATKGEGGVPGTYEEALATQQELRAKHLNPLIEPGAPIGQLARKDITTREAANALFPAAPETDSADRISHAVGELVKRNPGAAQQLVRAHIGYTLDQAASSLQASPGAINPAVGGKFFSKLVGNPQQRANMQAAVEALPNGKAKWQGLQNMLDIAQATAFRLNKGSLTAFNPEDIAALGSGSNLAETLKTATSPSLWTRIVNDKVTKWQVGLNLDSLVSIITDPKSGPLLQRLASMPRTSNEAGAIAARLMLLGDAATTKARQPLRVDAQPQETQTAGQ
jgi:hypothetical protein